MPKERVPGWLGTKDGAAYVGVTQRTLYRLIDEGHIPAFRIGRVLRLRQTDLDSFLDANRVTPGTLRGLYRTAGDNPNGL